MLNKIKSEFEKAVEIYLDEMLFSSSGFISSEKKSLLNTSLPFINFIRQDVPDDFQHSFPLLATWHVTSSCNLRCVHCFYNETDYSDPNELSVEQAQNLANELAQNLGIVKIILTGGEPFLRPDIMDIIEIFKRNNVSVFIQTNGLLINDEQIKRLSKIFSPYLDVLQISLDASTEQTFQKIRGSSHFSSLLEIIKKLVNNNIKVSINCTVNSYNINEISELYDVCRELGVMDFVVSRFKPCNDSHRHIMPDDESLMFLATELLNKEKIYKNSETFLALNLFSIFDLINNPDIEKIFSQEKYKRKIEEFPTPNYISCNHNDRLNIQSNGNVYMCMEAICENGCLGNVKKEAIVDIWDKRKKCNLYKPRFYKDLICQNCIYKKLCKGGCVGRAFTKYGDIRMPDSKCKKINLTNCHKSPQK